jgi:hypothetical protein
MVLYGPPTPSSSMEGVRPRAAELLTSVEYSRVRDNAWMYLTSRVTTRTTVGLVDVQGNYPTMLE